MVQSSELPLENKPQSELIQKVATILSNPEKQKALSNISRAVANRTTLPITQNVLLKVSNGKLQLSATNLEMAINTWIGAEITEEGETTVPARIFTDLIKSYPNDNIDLNLNNNNLVIKCGPYDSNLITQPSDDFPPIPESESLDPTFTISPSNFSKLINSVILLSRRSKQLVMILADSICLILILL